MAKKRRKKRLPLIIAESEASALLKAARLPRDQLIVYIGIFLGLRVEELSNLRVRDIDLHADVLLVREGKGDKDRAVPIHSKIKKFIQSALDGRQPSDPVFISKKGGALQPRMIQLLIKKLAKDAGLPDADRDRHYTPHKMRHYFATKLLESGTPIHEVSELLGHANIATTQVYLHVNPRRLKHAVDRLEVPAPPEPLPLFDR